MDKPWKREERLVAKAFQSKRKLMKGIKEKRDIESDLFTVDVKVRKRWQVSKWFDELKESAENRIPILVVRKPNRKTRLAIISFDLLIALLKSSGFLERRDV